MPQIDPAKNESGQPKEIIPTNLWAAEDNWATRKVKRMLMVQDLDLLMLQEPQKILIEDKMVQEMDQEVVEE